MNTIDIVVLFAIILFARLGIRLVVRYQKMKKEKPDENIRNQNQKEDE